MEILTSAIAIFIIFMKLFFFHCIGDFALQNYFVAANKGSLMFIHCTIYTGIMYFALWLLIPDITSNGLISSALFIFILHYNADNITCNVVTKNKSMAGRMFILNQIIHILIMCFVYFCNVRGI